MNRNKVALSKQVFDRYSCGFNLFCCQLLTLVCVRSV
jgi:hypothetical protein